MVVWPNLIFLWLGSIWLVRWPGPRIPTAAIITLQVAAVLLVFPVMFVLAQW